MFRLKNCEKFPVSVSLQNETPQAMEICIDSGTPAVPVVSISVRFPTFHYASLWIHVQCP